MSSKLKDKNILIIGFGIVGKAIAHYYSKRSVNQLLINDRYLEDEEVGDYCYTHKLGPYKVVDIDLDLIENSDNLLTFLCVPAVQKGKSFDLREVHYSLRKLDDLAKILEKRLVVLIKTTLIPGTTYKLQERYPNLILYFCPEFLTETTAIQDFSDPDIQVLGYSQDSDARKLATEILKYLPLASCSFITTAKNAEAIKLVRNTFFASKVALFNEIYEVLKSIGIDYQEIVEALGSCRMIAPYHLDIFHKGGRGAGGKCLPKDLNAFVNLGKAKKPILRQIYKYNKKLIKLYKK